MKLRPWSAKNIKAGTRVFLRIDVNVPLKHGQVQDAGVYGRIAQSLPEIDRLRKRGAIIILAAHLGEPHGKIDKKLSLAPVANVFEQRLKRPVPLIKDWVVPALKPGDVCLLENLRFNAGEENNSDTYAWKLAKLADVYVNNAFGVCHRRHASVHAIVRHLPAFAGELVLREVAQLSKALTKPFVLVLGGAKINTKLALLQKLGPKAERILLGGALAVTFLAAAEVELPVYPAGLMDERDILVARKLLRKFAHKLMLPVDLLAKPRQHLVCDIGPETQASFIREILQAQSIIWNGPLGITERADGMAGTLSVARAMSKSGARVVVGGGETVEFLAEHKLLKGFAHVSTGGGAMLAFLSGERMPGLEALKI